MLSRAFFAICISAALMSACSGMDSERQSGRSHRHPAKKHKHKKQESTPDARSAEELVTLARVALKEDRYDRCIELATKAIQKDQNLARAYSLRADASIKSLNGDDKTAESDLRTATALAPNNPEPHELLAELLYEKKDVDGALKEVTRAIELSPKDKGLNELRAGLYDQIGKKELAMADLQAAIDKQPEQIANYLVRAQYAEKYGLQDEALKDYSEGIKRSKQKITDLAKQEGYKRRAMLLSKMGRHKEAVADLSTVIKVNDDDDDALRLRGDEYAALNDFDRAVNDYTKAIELSPDYARASLEARAKAYEHLGKTALAKNDLEKAAHLEYKRAEKPVFELH